MGKETKSRILYIMKMLTEQTDEEHPLSIVQMIKQLSELDMSATRKTITEDIELLRQFGIDIVCVRGTQNKYFVGIRQFELPELKMLADAVASSAFLPKKKSAELIKKLTALTSTHQAETLRREVYVDNKSENEAVYYIVDAIHNAISNRKKIRFQYFDYSINKRKVLKHGGTVYVFSPYAMIWNDDRYYVIGYCERHESIATFRIDRMCKPEVTEEPAVPKPKSLDIEKYSQRAFRMYGSEICQVELFCAKDLMRVIIDRFGSRVKVKPYDKEYFIATVDVAPSPTFFGWVFQFENKIRIISPNHVLTKYKDCAKSMFEE